MYISYRLESMLQFDTSLIPIIIKIVDMKFSQQVYIFTKLGIFLLAVSILRSPNFCPFLPESQKFHFAHRHQSNEYLTPSAPERALR